MSAGVIRFCKKTCVLTAHSCHRPTNRQLDRHTDRRRSDLSSEVFIIIIIIIIIKNECHSNIIVDRLQGCGHSKKLREGDSESHSSKVV